MVQYLQASPTVFTYTPTYSIQPVTSGFDLITFYPTLGYYYYTGGE